MQLSIEVCPRKNVYFTGLLWALTLLWVVATCCTSVTVTYCYILIPLVSLIICTDILWVGLSMKKMAVRIICSNIKWGIYQNDSAISSFYSILVSSFRNNFCSFEWTSDQSHKVWEGLSLGVADTFDMWQWSQQKIKDWGKQ